MNFAFAAWIVISLLLTVLFVGYLVLRSRSQRPSGRSGPYVGQPAPARASSANTLALLGLIVSILSLISSTALGLLQIFKK